MRTLLLQYLDGMDTTLYCSTFPRHLLVDVFINRKKHVQKAAEAVEDLKDHQPVRSGQAYVSHKKKVMLVPEGTSSSNKKEMAGLIKGLSTTNVP